MSLSTGGNCLHALFERQSVRTPEAVAVLVGERRVSYRELDALAGAAARRLLDSGVGRGALVGICLQRDELLLAAMLGVLKAGAAYVPLDPGYPAQRLRFIAEDTGMRAVLTSPSMATRAAATGAPLVITGAEVAPAGLGPGYDPATAWGGQAADDSTDDRTPERPVGGTDPACVIYTSGSTGVPKGVVVEHHSVVNLLEWSARAFTAEELSGVLAATSVCFDVSVVELFTPLVTGGTVIMAADLLALPGLPAADRVRTVFGVPTGLAALTRLGLPPAVRTVVPGGEALTRSLADQLYAQPGVTRVLNCFGPTECTVYCAVSEVDRDGTGQPAIGAPVAGARLSLRDPVTGEPAHGGEGELWVAGPPLARGYLGRPELTAERFVTGPDGERWYRTGDLVRCRDGVHHYLGRLDDQVKVRGHRVELGEVQAALTAHPMVQHAVVLAPDDGYGSRQLVGYLEPVSEPPDEAGLRAWLRDRLPGQLLPARLVVLPRLPLGPTGKVDRSGLPAVGPVRDASVPFTAPRDPLEAVVAEVFADVLGLPEVGVHDQFGELGGHSLAATRVVATLAERLGRAIPLAWLLSEPTAAGLAGRLADPAGVPAAGPVRHPGQQVFPLTDLQREFWLARQVGAGVSTTVGFRLRLSTMDRTLAAAAEAESGGAGDPAGGVLSAAAVREALAQLVRRHEVLRTGFVEWDDGPVAVVRPPGPVPVAEVVASGEAARVAATQAVRHVFDLGGGEPLIRATLIRDPAAPATAELVIAVDHVACDGVSIGLLMDELAASLAGQPVPEPPVQVGDLARYEHDLRADATRLAQLRDYWRDRLAGHEPPAALTGGGDRADKHDAIGGGARVGSGERVVRPIPSTLVRALDEALRGTGGSRFAGYAAALAVVLHRLVGGSAQVIGTGAAVRDRPGLDRMIGPLVRVLPLVLPSGGDRSFRELISGAGDAVAGALAHQDLPADELARCAGFDRPPGAGLCPIILTMQPEGMPVVVERGAVRVSLAGEVATGMAVTELAFLVNQTDSGTEVQVEYDVGVYREPEVVSLLQLWLQALRELTADPDRPVSELELVDPVQRQRLREWGSGGPLPEPRPATVVEAIAEQAAARPEAVAVIGGGGALSYAALVDTAQRLATALHAAGVGRGDRVGVCVPRDRLLPAALLGVLWAGAAYVPLDVEYPADRLAWLASDCRARVVVSRGGALPVARAIPAVTVVDLDQLPPAGSPGSLPQRADLAYLLYTSGSTGRPKGVEVCHGNLADHTTAIRRVPGVEPADSVLAVAPLSFDAVGIEIWAPLASGACCVVVERDEVLDGEALVKRIAEVKATVAALPPTLLRILLAAGFSGEGRLRLWCVGEVLDPALVRQIAPHAVAVWNGYGPTETTTLSTAHQVAGPVEGTIVPIGRPLPGEWVYVMDHAGRLAPPGIVGELWIGGAGVARGYWDRPELTESAFVPDPYQPGSRCYRTGDLVRWNTNGELEFHGRADHQVKLRGQRLELGEIEAALHEHPEVSQAVVTVHGTGPDAVLVGYLVPETVDTDHVASFMAGRLPGYLVPGRWVRLPSLPTTTSGKVDRRGLPAPTAEAPGGGMDPPSSELEQFIAEIWAELLGTDRIGRGSDFFSLGGNSFAATRVAARLRGALGCEVPVGLLLSRPILADYATELERLLLAQLASGQGGQA